MDSYIPLVYQVIYGFLGVYKIPITYHQNQNNPLKRLRFWCCCDKSPDDGVDAVHMMPAMLGSRKNNGKTPSGVVFGLDMFLREKYEVCQWSFLVPLMGGRYHIIPQLAVYTTYRLPIGWLYITYHLVREPETAIEFVFCLVFVWHVWICFLWVCFKQSKFDLWNISPNGKSIRAKSSTT